MKTEIVQSIPTLFFLQGIHQSSVQKLVKLPGISSTYVGSKEDIIGKPQFFIPLRSTRLSKCAAAKHY